MASVWSVAKGIENEGMDFYRAQAAVAPSPELKGVFSLLADEEQKHYDLFTRLENKMPAVKTGSDTFAQVRSAFTKMTAGFATKEVLEDAVTVYRKALGMEQHTVKYYSEMPGQVTGESERKALSAIIDEEKRHVRIFESLMDFVARPQQWVENAEFYKLEDY